MPVVPLFNAAHAFQADPKPPVGERDFLEFIAIDNAGSYKCTLRLHGDTVLKTSDVSLIRVWSTARVSNNENSGGAVVTTFDPASTNTVLNGTKAIDTPFGVTDITFTAGGGPVANVPNALRIRMFGGGEREQWTDLVASLSAGGATYYDQATRILHGRTTLSRSQQAANTLLPLCDGGSWQTQLGDIESNWGLVAGAVLDPLPHSAIAAPMQSWLAPAETWDFTGLAECPDPGKYTIFSGGPALAHNGSEPLNQPGWVQFVRGGSIFSFVLGEWIVYSPKFPWPRFQ